MQNARPSRSYHISLAWHGVPFSLGSFCSDICSLVLVTMIESTPHFKGSLTLNVLESWALSRGAQPYQWSLFWGCHLRSSPPWCSLASQTVSVQLESKAIVNLRSWLHEACMPCSWRIHSSSNPSHPAAAKRILLRHVLEHFVFVIMLTLIHQPIWFTWLSVTYQGLIWTAQAFKFNGLFQAPALLKPLELSSPGAPKRSNIIIFQLGSNSSKKLNMGLSSNTSIFHMHNTINVIEFKRYQWE